MGQFIYNGKLEGAVSKFSRGKFKFYSSNGTLDWLCDAISGSTNFKCLPEGFYKASGFRIMHEKPFCQFGIGFGFDLIPQFKTSRTELMFHPDGNLPGTAGCIGGVFHDLEEIVAGKNFLAKIFEKNKEIGVTVTYH